MSNFCEKCGSLMLWDFSSGSKQRRCPRCGRIDGGNSKESGGKVENKTPQRNFSVRKGVSPRGSNYAASSMFSAGKVERKVLSRTDTVQTPSRKKETGSPAPEMFPFETVREGQLQFMEDVKKAFDEGRFLLANVPTGIGKTAAVLSPAVQVALSEGKLVLFMTSKQSQHKIAVETLRSLSIRTGRKIKVVDIISKQSMCPRDISKMPHSTFGYLCKQQSKDGTCNLFRPPPSYLTEEILGDIHDVEGVKELAQKARICPHKAALEAAKKANVVICDFNYLFSDLSDTVLSGLGKNISDIIIIVDEAHNLPDRIRSNQSEELPVRIVEEARDAVVGLKHLKMYLGQLRDLILEEARKRMGEEQEVELDKREFVSEIRALFQGSIDGYFDLEGFIEMLEDHSKKRSLPEQEDPIIAVSDFLRRMLSMKSSHILYFSIPTGRSVESLRLAFRNLDPGEISGPVFKGCSSAVLMSGTLAPPSMFGDILGMSRSRRTEKEYPSPFPTRNRLVLLDESVSTAYKKRNHAMYRSMGERIISMVGCFPGNVAVFFPSYSLLYEVKEYLWGCPKRTIEEERSMSRADKERIIMDLQRSKGMGGALLLGVMGGSLSEGVDYKDNLLSGVLVVGLPLAPPSLEVQALRHYFRNKFGFQLGDDYSYNYPAMNKILQAAGRSIRSETDRAVVVLMEDRLKQARYLKFLPEDLRPVKLEGLDIEDATSRFFKMR
ncbi:MAG: ATP-dependent DNA helicase [Candidatus Thermoplasmatota archaeon]|nr:ATP-dependent DNA helicase [Candidatus Thermoplasmatota archaeon]